MSNLNNLFDKIPNPNVWLRFKARDTDSDQLVDYRVQTITEKDFERVYDFMKSFFFIDEPLNASVDFIKDLDAHDEIKIIWQAVLSQRLSLVCYKEGSDEVVGCNFLCVKRKSDPVEKIQLKSKNLQLIIDGMTYAADQFNTFDHYQVDEFVSALGLSVNPRYRGRGIAVELLKARIPLCRASGIKLTANTFTGAISQVCARRAGFEVNYEISYEELGRRGFSFPKIAEKSIVLMSLPIKNE